IFLYCCCHPSYKIYYYFLNNLHFSYISSQIFFFLFFYFILAIPSSINLRFFTNIHMFFNISLTYVVFTKLTFFKHFSSLQFSFTSFSYMTSYTFPIIITFSTPSFFSFIFSLWCFTYFFMSTQVRCFYNFFTYFTF